MTLRSRFWLFALDACFALRLPMGVYYWVLGKASGAVYAGEPELPADDREEGPF